MRRRTSIPRVLFALVLVLGISVLGLYYYIYIKSGSSIPNSAPASQEPVLGPQGGEGPAPGKPAPQITFTDEDSFTQAEIDEIIKKVVNPLVNYYGAESPEILLTLAISKNEKESKNTYPYQGEANFQSGGKSGFLIMKEGSGVSWWIPECLNGCNLSSTYKTNFPEVAAKAQ